MKKPTIKYFDKHLDYLRKNGLYPQIYEIEGPSTSSTIRINNETYLTFCSNNYLGLAGHVEVKEQTKIGIDKYGTGSGSTRLLSGSLDIQAKFENVLDLMDLSLFLLDT